jgi:hypothetical protein
MTRIVVASLCLVFATAHAETGYTQRMFRRAMARDNLAVSGSVSSSALYLLISVCDRKSGAERVVCVTSNLLSGAIHMEYHLPYDIAGDRKEFEIAMSQPNRHFCFRSAKAANNIWVTYSPATLAEVRRRLADKSPAELRAEVDRQGRLNEKPWWHTQRYQSAVAHVLLERGILVGQADYTGALFLDK